MRFFSLYRVELRRLLLTKWLWLISAICLCAPLLGYTVYKPVISESMSGTYIGNPVIAGTAAGAVLWAVAAVIEANRQRRSGTDILAESAASPTAHSAAKTSALITISSIVTLFCSLAYLPFTAAKLDYLFDPIFYFWHFIVFMLPTWWISIFFAEGFYRITRRTELSAVLYAGLVYINYSRFAKKNFFLKWISPAIGAYSDGFPDIWYLRLGAYTRLVWLCISVGVWAFSLICIRKYQKGFIGSFIHGLKKIYLPLSAVFFIVTGTFLWNVQPLIGHGGDSYDIDNERTFLTITDIARPATEVSYSIEVDPIFGTLQGKAEYTLPSPKKGENVFRLNAGYKIKSITYDGENVDFRTVKEDINGQYDTYFELPEKRKKKLVIEYGGIPTIAKCMIPSVVEAIGENYIMLDDTDIAPRMKDYVFTKTIVLEVTLPNDLTPFISHKAITNFNENGNGTRTYKTAYINDSFLNFIAGKYVIDNFSSESGIKFQFVYGDIYRSAVEEYDVQQSICEVYDYCTQHYGNTPFVLSGKEFILFQLSGSCLGGYALPGISTWFEAVITPDVLSDPNRGANATEIFIHEMIHQWWGGLGMNCDESDGVWSCEGLTVYSTYRLVKEKYGELYAKQYYVDDWEKSVKEQDRNFYNRHPEYLDKLPKSYREQLSESNKDINKYKRMPLMLLKAEELLGGEEKMDEVLKKMFSDYTEKGEQYEVTYKEFLDYCGLTEEDLELD